MAEIRKEEIIQDGKLKGYRLYKVGTGVFGADQFEGYEWLDEGVKKVLEHGISVEKLLKSVPDEVAVGPMLKNSFTAAKEAARKCDFSDLISRLVSVGEGIANASDVVIDAFYKETITKEEKEDFLDKMVSFQHQTVMNEIGELLAKNCGCKV